MPDQLAKRDRSFFQLTGRLWRVSVALVLVVGISVVVSLLLLGMVRGLRSQVSESHALSIQNRTVFCINNIEYPNRAYSIPRLCLSQSVRVMYPQDLCSKFLPTVTDCGRDG